MNDESIERLELKLAFVERANQELSDVVYRQQQELDALRLQVQGLIAQFEVLREEPTKYSAEQERPPHY
jgi:SlyX protein